MARVRWLPPVMLAGAAYLVAGIVFAALSAPAPSHRMGVAWRLAAWVTSAAAFAAHIGYEHFRLRNAPRRAAWHASVAVAFGAFALALAANIHDLGSASGYRMRMLIALAAWPLLTAVPAFIVALVVAAGLARTRPRS